jgi:hypothetical protein
MTERDGEKSMAAEMADCALSCLKKLLPAHAIAMFKEETAKEVIDEFSRMLKGAVAAAPDIREARKDVRWLTGAYKKVAIAAKDARRELEKLDVARDELFGGTDPNHPPVDGWEDDPEQLLSEADYDQFQKNLEAVVEDSEKLRVAAAAALAPGRFLAAVKAGRGRAPGKALQDHVKRCAAYVAGLGAENVVQISEDRPFHDFVEAVAAMGGICSISRRHFMAGVQSYRDSPKLDEPEFFSD